MTIIRRSVSELIPYTNNPRTHPERQIKQLAELIERFGFHDSHAIAIDEQGVIIWGHGRLEAAKLAGKDEVPVEVLTGLSTAEKQTLRIADNGIAEQSDWDMEALARELAELDEADINCDLLSLDDELLEELGDVFLGGDESDFQGHTDEDEVPDDEDVETRVKRGDIWQLGRHRIMCGDSASTADVAFLMGGEEASMIFTDPPYGVSYQGKTQDALTIENDNVSPDKLQEMIVEWFDCVDLSLKDGGYLLATVPAGPLHLLFAQDWKRRGWLRQIMVWNKSQMVLGHSEYHYKHEPILFGWKPGDRLKNSDRTKTTVWDFDKPLANREHPTMKPVEMWCYGIKNHSLPGDIVYEPFLGSGTALIACEKTERACYGMEISEHYCDVVIQRWEEFTGQKAERIQQGQT